MAQRPRPGILDPSTNNPFAHPSGWLGRLAGRIMLWTNKQDDVVSVLDVQPGDDVLEVGYGPGGLIRLIAARTEAGSIELSPVAGDVFAARAAASTPYSMPGSLQPIATDQRRGITAGGVVFLPVGAESGVTNGAERPADVLTLSVREVA